jgi:hypothetical protein
VTRLLNCKSDVEQLREAIFQLREMSSSSDTKADPALFVLLQTSPALPLLIKKLSEYRDPPGDELATEDNQQAWNICSILQRMAAFRSSFAGSIIELVCVASN